ncbi:DUF3265 domain-containing protein [Vibrio vulnificus]|nr:DUF3265 domain-containing protein [Vibrio vulnificus]
MFCAICRTKLTRRSRGIHAAWHFWYAVSFGGERGVLKVGLSGIHPLTQRYILVTICTYMCTHSECMRI